MMQLVNLILAQITIKFQINGFKKDSYLKRCIFKGVFNRKLYDNKIVISELACLCVCVARNEPSK